MWKWLRRLWLRSEIAATELSGAMNQLADEQLALGQRPGLGPAMADVGVMETAAHGIDPAFEQARYRDEQGADETVARLRSELADLEAPDDASGMTSTGRGR